MNNIHFDAKQPVYLVKNAQNDVVIHKCPN